MGSAAFFSAWPKTTFFSGAPLARAVLIYSCRIVSSMAERVKRSCEPAEVMDSATVGKIYPRHVATPLEGNIFRLSAKVKMSSIPSQKAGTEAKKILTIREMVSNIEYCLTADRMPSGMPIDRKSVV